MKSSILGDPIRRIPSEEKTLYLTFDDGPCRDSTPCVLEALDGMNVPATFFMVAQAAERNPVLAREIAGSCHAIGNHSLDHTYGKFFQGKAALADWVRKGEALLREVIGTKEIVGFRPPAGVRTPELASALRDLEIPMILWDQRFFDAVLPFTPQRGARAARRARAGSIILLHDRQPEKRTRAFVGAITSYIKAARDLGFEFKSLTRAQCEPGKAFGSGHPL